MRAISLRSIIIVIIIVNEYPEAGLTASTLSQKNVSLGVLSIYLPNINRFSKLLHWHTHWTICNKVICEYTTTP